MASAGEWGQVRHDVALCTKAYRGWPEEVFNKRSTGVHALLTPEAMMESIVRITAKFESRAIKKHWATRA